jgi:uncharacterized protein (UPF0147 family)
MNFKLSKADYIFLGIVLGFCAILFSFIRGKSNNPDTVSGSVPNTPQEIKIETTEQIIAKIKTDTTWVRQIKDRAKEAGVSFEEKLKSEAEWIVEQQKQKLNGTPTPQNEVIVVEKLEDVIAKIKSDTTWVRQIKVRAKESGVSLEEKIASEAKYIIELQKQKAGE